MLACGQLGRFIWAALVLVALALCISPAPAAAVVLTARSAVLIAHGHGVSDADLVIGFAGSPVGTAAGEVPGGAVEWSVNITDYNRVTDYDAVAPGVRAVIPGELRHGSPIQPACTEVGHSQDVSPVCVATNTGRGAWGAAAESMSSRAAAYQAQITGRSAGSVYRVNGVKFDGFANGVLQEARGPGYAKFVSNGQFQPWFSGADGLASQAQRQVAAAGGTPVTWSVAEGPAATAINNLFVSRGISGINVVHVP